MVRENLSAVVYCSDCGEELSLDGLSREELRIFESGIPFVLWSKPLQEKWVATSWASDPCYLCPPCFDDYDNKINPMSSSRK